MKYDAGSPILIEVEFKKVTPFDNYEYYDPDTSSITITDPDDVVKVDEAALTQTDTGKYYYVCQTLEGWAVGIYRVRIDSTSGSYSDVENDYRNFQLR